MEIHAFELGSFQVSAYVVIGDGRRPQGPSGAEKAARSDAEADASPDAGQSASTGADASPEVMIVDAPQDAGRIVQFLRGRRLAPKVLVNTHGHADHIYANKLLRQTWPEMAIACGKEDASLLESPFRNLSPLMAAWIKSPKPDRLLVEGDRIEVGASVFEVIETPGHSPGGISLYCQAGPDGRPIVFTGDALFAGSIGRTDFPGARHETLVRTVREKLLSLPGETRVYPGHGPTTTIDLEDRTNPFL